MALVEFYTVRLLRMLSAFCMGSVFMVMLVNSVLRYGIGKSFVWAEEVSIYGAIYGVIFAAALAYIEGTHVRFTAITMLLPRVNQRQILYVTHALTMAVGLGLVWSGVEFVSARGAMISSGLAVPMRYALLAMPLGGALLSFAALLRLVNEVNSLGTETRKVNS